MTRNLAFTEDELIAGHGKSAVDNPAAAQWAQRGYCVFKRGDWYLIVNSYDADIEF